MNADIRTRLLSYVRSNFVMKDIYIEQFLVLIDLAQDLSHVHVMIGRVGPNSSSNRFSQQYAHTYF